MKIQELLDKPEKWTQYTSARDINGKDVGYEADSAVCWCLIGAILKCYGEKSENVMDKIYKAFKGESIALYNDAKERTFKDVMKLVKELDI